MTKNRTIWAPRALLAGVAALALTACAETGPNPNIADARGRLNVASNDKLTAERGQGDLANARSALTASESDWARGEKDKSTHELMMATTYLDLAETRGQQAGVEQETVKMRDEAALAGKNRMIAGKDRQIASRDAQLVSRDAQLATKDQQLADARDQLQAANMKPTELGSTMVLQDVSFETGKSVLLAGGVNRLQPLANYLRLSPETRVRIEGFTDSRGGAAMNLALSLERATSVKADLVAANIDGSRIEVVGSGEDKPVASNATVSGRQSNRRVEITLLKSPGQ